MEIKYSQDLQNNKTMQIKTEHFNNLLKPIGYKAMLDPDPPFYWIDILRIKKNWLLDLTGWTNKSVCWCSNDNMIHCQEKNLEEVKQIAELLGYDIYVS